MDVSENSGTPKSSIFIRFSIINHPFWGTTIFGNTEILFLNHWFFRGHVGFGASLLPFEDFTLSPSIYIYLYMNLPGHTKIYNEQKSSVFLLSCQTWGKIMCWLHVTPGRHWRQQEDQAPESGESSSIEMWKHYAPRWAPNTSYNWGFIIPVSRVINAVTQFMRPFTGVTAPFTTGKGPTCINHSANG